MTSSPSLMQVDVSTLSETGMMVAMKISSTVSSSRHPTSFACSSMGAGLAPVSAAIFLSGSSPIQSSSSPDRLERTASCSIGGREECSPWGAGVGRGVGAGVAVSSGVGVFGINAVIAATVPAAGVSGVGAPPVQAIRAAIMIRSREVMGRRGFSIVGGPRFVGVRPEFYRLHTPVFPPAVISV